jgi:hypothetical protein
METPAWMPAAMVKELLERFVSTNTKRIDVKNDVCRISIYRISDRQIRVDIIMKPE